jgi:hypothetical protein
VGDAVQKAFGRMHTTIAADKQFPFRQTLRGGGYKYQAESSRGVFHTAMKGNHDYDYDYLCIGGGSGGVRS